MDFGIWYLKRKERNWIAKFGEIPDGVCLSFGFLGLGRGRLVYCVKPHRPAARGRSL